MGTAREFVMGLPEALQGVGVFLVSFIPFVEGEGAAIIGVLAGISPWLAVPVGIVGNFLVVALLVYAAHGARGALMGRRAARRGDRAPATADGDRAPESAGRALLRERFERWGVPGLSLIGPWVFVPGHVAAPAMVSFGASRDYVMVWQTVAIVLYTAVGGLLTHGILTRMGVVG
ncbi:hypothetical protein [Micrococcus lylae]|nr:hypothetical protein [Micrococcus lylae]